jgi:putative transposase
MSNNLTTESAEQENSLSKVIKIDEARIQSHLDKVVRSTVEQTLNDLLDAEAEHLCNAKRYEHTDTRSDQRAGHYTRSFHTKAGPVELKVPKLRMATFETAIIERYRRRESSVEEALIEMYLAGVSVRRVEDVTEALWGTRVSAGTVSELNKKVYGRIEQWRQIRTNNPLERLMREIRRRTRVVGCFPDGQSALMLAAARLRHIAGTRWGTKRYMSMNRLDEMKVEQLTASA